MEDCGAAARNETGRGGREWSGSLLRLVVELSGEHAHRVETGPNVMAGSLAPSAQHAVGQPVLDALVPSYDRLGARTARARVRRDLVAQREHARDPGRDTAAHDLFDDRATHAADPAGVRHGHQLLACGVQPADAGTEGLLADWLVSEGDFVEEGEIILEAVFVKTNFEIPSPVSGIITEICIQKNERFKENIILAKIDETTIKSRMDKIYRGTAKL